MRQNVNESEKGGNEGFTYMTLKTWSGSAKMRELETHRFKWESKKTIGSLKTHADSLNGEYNLKQKLLHLHSDTTTNR